MPLTLPKFTQKQMLLFTGAGCAMVMAGLLLVIDPSAHDRSRAEAVALKTGAKAGRTTEMRDAPDVGQLVDAPIFMMSTGASPYREKTLVLSGLAMSRYRKAVLVSIDGAVPRWMSVGEAVGDITLLDVTGDGGVFDTPLGQRTLSVASSAALAANGQGDIQVSRPPVISGNDDDDGKPYVRPPLASGE